MINVKEGLANITSIPIERIEQKNFIRSVNTVTPDLSYTYYKLIVPRNEGFHKVTTGVGSNVLMQQNLISSFDFSINDVSYTSSFANPNPITDASFINLHMKYGMFGLSDASNTMFYHYKTTSLNSTVRIDLEISYNTTNRNRNFNMLFKEFSGNIYEPSSNLHLTGLNVYIKSIGSDNPKELIKNGQFVLTTVNSPIDPVRTQIQTASGGTATATATGGSVTLGDTNLNLGLLSSLFGADNRYSDSEIYSYLLQDGGLGAYYVPPIYNNFETAMNLPSNPIANPVNSMNPLDYAESLFGPKISPSMAKNSYLNQSDATTLESSANTMKSITSQTPNFDYAGNLLAQNSDGFNSNSNSNSNSNTINTNKNIAKEDYPPCPAPQRCPEPNFECKKMPKYEQGIDNAFLPRPVLTDFSTFGM
jgi:hypothetical protein